MDDIRTMYARYTNDVRTMHETKYDTIYDRNGETAFIVLIDRFVYRMVYRIVQRFVYRMVYRMVHRFLCRHCRFE